MRRSSWAFLLLLAACGGGSEPTQPPPPPPPPPSQPGPPASVTIQAGDAQEGEPGKPLPANPAVLVRDANGRATPGIPVAFAVESGGGTVSVASVSTGSDGIASVTWTLGASDGPESLQATVAGIPAVHFTATGKFPLATLIDAAVVPASGGTSTYTKQGDPLSGLTITVPAGTYPDPTTFSVQVDRNQHPALPADVKQIGPAFLVTSGKGFADQPMAITLPVTVGGDSVLAAFFFDPATGTLESVPMVGRDAGTITLATRHFSADQLLVPGGAASIRSAAPVAPAFGKIYLVAVATTPAALNVPLMTAFTPGTDDWEFENKGTFLSSNGICAGMSISAMYYFYRFRPAGRALYHQFDTFLAMEWDNPQGERFASVVQHRMDWPHASNWMQTLRTYAQRSGISYAQLMYQTAAMTIKVSHQPLLMLLSPPLGSGAGHAVVAYGVNNGKVFYADPNQPGVTGLSVPYAVGLFGFVNLATSALDPPVLMQVDGMIGATSMVNMRSLDTWWADLTAHHAGDTDFPAVQRQMFDIDNQQWVNIAPNAVIQTTHRTLALRTLCPQCPAPTRTIPPTKRAVTVMGDSLNRIWAIDGQDPDTAAVLIFGRGPGNFRLSMETYFKSPSTFVDQTFLTIVPSPIVISPGPTTVPTGVDITFTLEHNNVGGATAKFVWDFGDGTPKVTKSGDSTVTHHWNTIGDYNVTAELQDVAGKRLGGDQTVVTVADGPFIKFTIAGFWDPATTPPNGSYGYTNGQGGRTPSVNGDGLDYLFLGFNIGPAGTVGVLVTLVVPAAHVFAAGQTFTLHMGGPAQAGQWKLLLSRDQSDPDNSDQRSPGYPTSTGTLRLDAVALQPDGSFIGQYSFTVTSPLGGTITGSGLNQWTFIPSMSASTCSGPLCKARLP